MEQLNIIIVEDESIVALDIKQSLEKFGYNITKIFSNGKDLKEFLSIDNLPDLILMDITIKGEYTGIELAEYANQTFDIPIVFLTAHSDEPTLSKAKRVNPYGYLLKPFKEVELQTAIEIAFNQNEQKKLIIDQSTSQEATINPAFRQLYVKSQNKFIKIKVDEILFIEALKDYVMVCTFNQKHKVHVTMKDLILKLPHPSFVRVHRSFIVNLQKVTAIDYKNSNLEIYKNQIPIGASYKENVLGGLNMI